MALVSKNFSDIITFTRASTATYFDASGTLQSAATDAPRFDYNPSTLAAQGLLIEEGRTNVLAYSEQFNDAYWTKGNSSITANAATSPSGTLTGDKLVEDATNNTHRVAATSISVTSGTVYTLSLFAKASERSAIQLSLGADASAFPLTQAIFSLVGAGSFTTVSGTPNAVITNIGNGWYRCTISATASATTASAVIRFFLCNGTASGSDTYLGDGTSGLFFWGAQLEAGAFPTSYIPTTTTALTRSADVASVNTLSPWYNSASGTLYVQGILVGGTAATFPYQSALVGSNANNDSIGVNWGANAGTMRWNVRVGGASQVDQNAGSGKSAGSSYKFAGRYATNDFQLAVDGTLGTPDTTGSLPTITALSLGGPVSFQTGASVWLQRVTYYPRGLANAELQAITA
jgi:hypothetical protein